MLQVNKMFYLFVFVWLTYGRTYLMKGTYEREHQRVSIKNDENVMSWNEPISVGCVYICVCVYVFVFWGHLDYLRGGGLIRGDMRWFITKPINEKTSRNKQTKKQKKKNIYKNKNWKKKKIIKTKRLNDINN